MNSKKITGILSKPPVAIFTIAVVLNFVMEILGRRSLISAFIYLGKNPFSFICGVLIIAVTLSIGLFAKRRVFMFTLITIAWLVLGVTNFVLLGYRTTPLSNVDFKIIKSALKMIGIYLSISQIIILGILILAAIVCVILVWFKSPKYKISLKNAVSVLSVLLISTILITGFGVNAQTVSEDFTNLPRAYDDYGFVYCFSRTIFDNGINMPEDYTEDSVNDIIDKLERNDDLPAVMPNIVVVQLESFFDVKYLIDPKYAHESDPIPNFTRLRDEYPSGFYNVPVVGSGTAYTEFETLTGMNVDWFGFGECPYYTALKTRTCDSAVSTLKKHGYGTHAIHNNTGSFYDRNIVYSNLGFDTFTPLEYMYNTEYTEYGWAKDYVLTNSIADCLNSTETSDFVFAVSVQAHGNYPNDTETSAYEYFVSQLKEVDDFIGKLTDMLFAFDEPTMLILYGDHLPAIELYDEDLSNGDLRQTEYIIWSNYEIPQIPDEDIKTYDLFAKIFNIININADTIIEARQNNLDDSEILTLAYDILYGENYSNSIENEINLTMGIRPIEITGVYYIGDSVRIRGNNFNEYSVVFINGDEKDTTFIDNRTLIVPDEKIKNGDAISVAQLSANKTLLSETDQFIYNQINHNEEE
jgi:Phosphoglycerol transferase and related proteins, alkaline phosphatase superfamily